MKPDGTSSFSTADEKLVSPEGNHVTEQENKSGSEVKKCHQSDETTWSYLFVHHLNHIYEYQTLLSLRMYLYFTFVAHSSYKSANSLQKYEN